MTLDYAGSIDGVPFEGGTAEAQELTIGSGHFIPGFEDQMIGMEIGEERDLHVTFKSTGKEAVRGMSPSRKNTAPRNWPAKKPCSM